MTHAFDQPLSEPVRPRRRRLAWIAAALGALFLLGGLAGGIGVGALLGAVRQQQRFVAPGAAQVRIAEPGEQTIWVFTTGQAGGRPYGGPPELPAGAAIAVHAEGGEAIPVRPGERVSLSRRDERMTTAGAFDAPGPGIYTIEVSGFSGERLMAVGRSFERSAGWVLGLLGGGALLFVASGIGLVVTLVRLLAGDETG